MKKKIAIVNYGVGNLGSIGNALSFLQIPFSIISNPNDLKKYDSILLPGVGAFAPAIQKLKVSVFAAEFEEEVRHKKKNILGICLGFQLLCDTSSEGGLNKGLGFIKAPVERFTRAELLEKKSTHIGFNSVNFKNRFGAFAGLKEWSDFYFVHSYRVLPFEVKGSIGTCEYGSKFLAAFQQRNIIGVQFHPEKSQSNGLRLLYNFSKL